MYRRRWAKSLTVAASSVALLAGGCNTSLSGAENQIRDLAGQMEEADLGCSDLLIEDAGPIRESPTGSPVAIKIGRCTLQDAPERNGVPLATDILIFEDDSHKEFLPPAEALPGRALVYGDTWQILVVPGDLGEDVQEATAGTLVMGEGELPLPTSAP